MLSILVITARFRIEALLSPVATLIPWAVLIFIMQQIKESRGGSLNFSLMFIGIAAIVIYWIRDMNITSINWLRALLLHVANLSTLFILYLSLLYLEKDNDFFTEKTLFYPVMLGITALLLNVFFLYQYYRHMHLPMKNK
jgi:DMSO/TMAO reductase YedYZ heme-binding membrane subunit